MKKVEAEISLQVEPARALAAFTDPDMLAEWWGVEKQFIELQQGGLYTLAWHISDQGIQYVSTGRINAYEEGRRLEVVDMLYLTPDKPFLGPMRLLVKTRPTKNGCVLTVLQDGYQDGPVWDAYYESVVHAWPPALQNLKAYLERDS